MSIFNLFTSSAKPTEDEEKALNAAISRYNALVAEERKLSGMDSATVRKKMDLKRIMAHQEARETAASLLQDLQARGRDVVGFRCYFYTAAVGDQEWIGDESNRRTVAADFAALRKKDFRRYEMLRGLYWGSYSEFWGFLDADGRRAIPTNFFAYPGYVFPANERQGF